MTDISRFIVQKRFIGLIIFVLSSITVLSIMSSCTNTEIQNIEKPTETDIVNGLPHDPCIRLTDTKENVITWANLMQRDNMRDKYESSSSAIINGRSFDTTYIDFDNNSIKKIMYYKSKEKDDFDYFVEYFNSIHGEYKHLFEYCYWVVKNDNGLSYAIVIDNDNPDAKLFNIKIAVQSSLYPDEQFTVS